MKTNFLNTPTNNLARDAPAERAGRSRRDLTPKLQPRTPHQAPPLDAAHRQKSRMERLKATVEPESHTLNLKHHTRRVPLTPRQNSGALTPRQSTGGGGSALDSSRGSARKAGALPLSVRGERGATPGTPGDACFFSLLLSLSLSVYPSLSFRVEWGGTTPRTPGTPGVFFWFYSAFVHFIACRVSICCRATECGSGDAPAGRSG